MTTIVQQIMNVISIVILSTSFILIILSVIDKKTDIIKQYIQNFFRESPLCKNTDILLFALFLMILGIIIQNVINTTNTTLLTIFNIYITFILLTDQLCKTYKNS